MGPGGLWWSNVLNSALSPQSLRPDTQPEHQDPVSHMAAHTSQSWLCAGAAALGVWIPQGLGCILAPPTPGLWAPPFLSEERISLYRSIQHSPPSPFTAPTYPLKQRHGFNSQRKLARKCLNLIAHLIHHGWRVFEGVEVTTSHCLLGFCRSQGKDNNALCERSCKEKMKL